MSDTVETVTPAADTVTADTSSTTSPDTSSSSVAAPDSAVTASPAASSPARTYTDADVQRILRERIAQANKSFEKRSAEYDKKLKDYEAVVARANAGIEGMARGFGFIKDEPEKPWASDIQAAQERLEKQYQERLEGVERQRFLGMIQSDFDRVKQAYPKYAGLPGFKDAFAQTWKPGQDPVAGVKAIVSEYEKVLAAASNAAAEEKAAVAKTAPVGRGGGTSPAKTPEGPLRDRLKAALKASRA